MQRLEVSGAVRQLYGSFGVKVLISSTGGQHAHSQEGHFQLILVTASMSTYRKDTSN